MASKCRTNFCNNAELMLMSKLFLKPWVRMNIMVKYNQQNKVAQVVAMDKKKKGEDQGLRFQYAP